MKRTIFTICIAIMQIVVYGQKEIDVDSKVDEVVVYQTGAQISRKANIKIFKGKQILLFKGLSSKINSESIQVKAPDDLIIISVTSSFDYFRKKDYSETIIDLKREQNTISDSLNILRRYKDIYLHEKGMILSNKSIGGLSGVSIQDLQKAADFFRVRLMDIESNIIGIDMKSIELRKRIADITRQLSEFNMEGDDPTSTIKVVISSESSLDCELTIEYIIDDAGWTPNYDVRIDDVDAPMSLFYKAKVSQNTGEDWNDVVLSLSTGNPSISNSKPELNPFYLDYNNFSNQNYSNRKYEEIRGSNDGTSMVFGQVYDENGDAIILGNVAIISGGNLIAGVETDFDGKYKISNLNPGLYDIRYSYVGYADVMVQNINLVAGKMLRIDQIMQSGITLDEVAIVEYNKPLIEVDNTTTGTVTSDEIRRLPSRNISGLHAVGAGVSQSDDIMIRGGRAASTEYYYDGIRVSGNMYFRGNKNEDKYIPLSISKHQVSTLFKIDIPYTIPSDNKDYDVVMVEYHVPAHYSYSAVPKVSTDAFLIARIKDWEQYNLLNGEVSLFFKGIFQGHTYLDLDSFDEELNISVGRDPDIIIEREQVKDFSKKRTVGSNIKEEKKWMISVKNNKKIPIEIEVEDQYPVSRTNDIKVDLVEESGAEINEENGKMKWLLSLKPREKKELVIDYVVKFDKYRILYIE